MKSILSNEDYKDFVKFSGEKPYRGVLVNTLKCDIAKFGKIFPYHLAPTPFAHNGFYIDTEDSMGNNPLHHAGAFYMQEPSAMSVATLADIKEGEKVLDLCASPGGKSIGIACALKGTGLLWSNEISAGRAKVLLSNIERMGIRNAVVSNCDSQTLADKLPRFFDTVIVDAPCSGEGMLSRGKAEYEKWSINNAHMCHDRQLEILNCAKKLLKSGGKLVYSTCTFNITENEETVREFLRQNNDFSLPNTNKTFGREGLDMAKARRIFPMDGGEGHFIAVMKDEGDNECVKHNRFTADNVPAEFSEFWKNTMKSEPPENLMVIGKNIYCVPELFPKVTGLRILRAGVLLGEIKPKRFVPAHNLYTSANKENFKRVVDLPGDSEEILRYLHGEEIAVSNEIKGYTLVCTDGIPLGGGKAGNAILKNHYPKGLRNLK